MTWKTWFLWLAGCIVTGLLAGLGSPFWYDAVSRITTAAKAMRGARPEITGKSAG